MLECGVGKGSTAPGFGRILPRGPVDAEEFLDALVVGLDIRVPKRPGRADTRWIPSLLEVLDAKPGETRSVDLRVSANYVVNPRRELSPGIVDPHLLRLISAMNEDLFRGPILRLARKEIPAFDHEYVDTALR